MGTNFVFSPTIINSSEIRINNIKYVNPTYIQENSQLLNSLVLDILIVGNGAREKTHTHRLGKRMGKKLSTTYTPKSNITATLAILLTRLPTY